MQLPQGFNIFSATKQNFESLSLKVFAWQYEQVGIYKHYCDIIGKTPDSVNRIEQIPFLPISFFKTNNIIAGNAAPQAIFESSGTTGNNTSRHCIKDLKIYEDSFLKSFNFFYGEPKNWSILALLPSYLERNNSSLVYMANKLIMASGNDRSGFYLDDFEALQQKLQANEQSGTNTLLLGVTFALLDFAEKFPMKLRHTSIMETGGMKGRRKELLRQEVHEILSQAFGLENIHSEYGMTELLSQAYSKAKGIFYTMPWMKVLVRDEDDPASITISENISQSYKTGAANIIDLANVFSCSFIATDDIARLYKDGSFEILGRLDYSDIRGCSQLSL